MTDLREQVAREIRQYDICEDGLEKADIERNLMAMGRERIEARQKLADELKKRRITCRDGDPNAPGLQSCKDDPQ